MNKISIIIPIYNTEKYLRRCLDSVKEIAYPIECILIDDGSSDSSGRICDDYAFNDDRFLVIHQSNKGLVKARQIGIRATKSQYFTFVDSDDYIDSKAYDLILNCVSQLEKQVDMCCFGMKEIYQEKITVKKNRRPNDFYEGENLESLKRQMLSYGDFFAFGILPNAVCKFFSTDFVKSHPYHVSPNVTVGEDADMVYQLLLQAESVYVSDMTPYYYCRREDSMMWKKKDESALMSLKNDLKSAFIKNTELKENLMNQLDNYMDFVHLLCNPGAILDKLDFFQSSTDRIAIYGAGGVGKAVKNGMNNNFTLWVDRNFNLFKNDNVKPIEALKEEYNSYDKIFIAISSDNTCRQVKQELINMGIDKPIYYYRMD